MKKIVSLMLGLVMISAVWGCSSASTDHNGKVCPKGSESKVACNRTPPKSPGSN